jgi:hypothetical protein
MQLSSHQVRLAAHRNLRPRNPGHRSGGFLNLKQQISPLGHTKISTMAIMSAQYALVKYDEIPKSGHVILVGPSSTWRVSRNGRQTRGRQQCNSKNRMAKQINLGNGAALVATCPKMSCRRFIRAGVAKKSILNLLRDYLHIHAVTHVVKSVHGSARILALCHVMQVHVHRAIVWDRRRCASAANMRSPSDARRPTTIPGGVVVRYAEKSCLVASMSACGHATKVSAEVVKLECQLDAIAAKWRKT